MTPAELLKPIIGGGIRSVNFFNGRLLSGEDMSREQEANREADKMLGRAIGDGIAYGLEVSRAVGSGTAAVVTVQPGLAINRNGETLRLPSPVNLSLVRPQNGSGKVADAGFSSCTPFQSGVYVSGSGVYLLTVSAARANEGRAAVSGLQNSAADCNTKYMVDGVQFRLIQIELTPEELNNQDHLRNLVAYKCFGVSSLWRKNSDQYVEQLEPNGLIDDLRPNRVTDCDVPLAMLFWTASDGIRFVDNWSVRRRTIHRAVNDSWDVVLNDRWLAEGEAMLLQFQEHIETLRTENLNLELAAASQYFRYLPPAGLIPVRRASFRGVNVNTFFTGMTHRAPEFIDASITGSLMKGSFRDDPIDISNSEMVWLYKVWQNEKASLESAAVQPFVIFTTPHMTNSAIARYDVAHWDYSNYARGADCEC
jgi:hypothetical protein